MSIYSRRSGFGIWRNAQLEEHCFVTIGHKFRDCRYCYCDIFTGVSRAFFGVLSKCSFESYNLCNVCRYVDELLYWSGRRMMLDEFLQGDLVPNRLPPAWVSRTRFVFQSDDGGLAVLDTTNDTVRPLVTNHTLVSKFWEWVEWVVCGSKFHIRQESLESQVRTHVFRGWGDDVKN